MIRFTPTENSQPKVGDILLSEPFLNDPYFGRKAVLICEYNDDGAFGLVLNNFVEVNAEELHLGLSEISTRISIGGPVNSSSLYFIHICGDLEGAVEIIDGVFLGGDFDSLKEKINNGLSSDNYRLFIGYSGWDKDQLMDEIKTRSWFVTQISASKIMSSNTDNEKYWQELIKGMGKGYEHIADAPIDPSLN
jgi:putative transcriptional regulator